MGIVTSGSSLGGYPIANVWGGLLKFDHRRGHLSVFRQWNHCQHRFRWRSTLYRAVHGLVACLGLYPGPTSIAKEELERGPEVV